MSITPSVPGAEPSLSAVLGPLVLSVCFNAFFYGFSVLQFIQYRTRLFRDNLLTQVLVSWTFLVDTFHTGALCWMIWYMVIQNFDNPSGFNNPPWPFSATPTFIAATSAPIEIYFAYRVRVLSGSRLLFWIIVSLSVVTNAMAFVSTAVAFNQANVSDYKHLLPVIDTWLGSHVVCGVAISAALMYYSARSRTGFRRYDTVRNKIAQAFIESSLLTSMFTLADLVIFSTLPTTNYHLLLGIPMGRVYTCTLIAMLNARLKLREDEADGIVTPERRRSYERHVEFAKAFGKMQRSGPTEVRVGVSVREEVEIVSLPGRGDSASSAAPTPTLKMRDMDVADAAQPHSSDGESDRKVAPV